jgi:hypothetical protein
MTRRPVVPGFRFDRGRSIRRTFACGTRCTTGGTMPRIAAEMAEVSSLIGDVSRATSERRGFYSGPRHSQASSRCRRHAPDCATLLAPPFIFAAATGGEKRRESRNHRRSFNPSWSAKAGHPVIAAISVLTGSSACADDDRSAPRSPHERSDRRRQASCGRNEIRGKPRGRSRISIAFNPGYLLEQRVRLG